MYVYMYFSVKVIKSVKAEDVTQVMSRRNSGIFN